MVINVPSFSDIALSSGFMTLDIHRTEEATLCTDLTRNHQTRLDELENDNDEKA